MRFQSVVAAVTLLAASAVALDEPLDIKIDRSVECTRKSVRGDKVAVHYRGTLASDGSEFDASYNRGTPLEFHVGKGQVIKGWDEGLLDMCIGDKRTLTIQPDWAYGSRAMGPIPANSVLVFETELMGIGGVQAEPQKEL